MSGTIGATVNDFKCGRTVPSLVYSCQRVLTVNIDSITSFGAGIPHRLIRPILQGCNADTLLRLERETPHLQERTSELWKDICVRAFPIAAEQILNSGREEPESWRDEFFCIRDREAKRFEEAANKIRNQRIEAEELKRKRQAKLTDRLPPPKRTRSSAASATPKTLFEKTRREATKIQKNVFGQRVLPPPAPGNSNGFRTKVDVTGANLSQKDSSSVLRSIATEHSSCAPYPRTPSLSSKSPRKSESTLNCSELKKSLSAPIPKNVSIPAMVLPEQRNPSHLQKG